MEDNNKLLVDGTIRIPEVDQDDDNTIDHSKTSEAQYVFSDIIDNIGKDEFRELYLSSQEFILNTSLNNQQTLCKKILKKIELEYDILFLEKKDLVTNKDLKEVYNLIEFLEYDYVDFVSSIWRFLDVDLLKINIDEYCNTNSNKIIKELDEQLEIQTLPKMVSECLRTNTKSVVVSIFSRMTEKSKIEILINTKGGM